jgi:hypothetical protein
VRRRVRRARARPFAARRGVGGAEPRESETTIDNNNWHLWQRRIVTNRLARKDTSSMAGSIGRVPGFVNGKRTASSLSVPSKSGTVPSKSALFLKRDPGKSRWEFGFRVLFFLVCGRSFRDCSWYETTRRRARLRATALRSGDRTPPLLL